MAESAQQPSTQEQPKEAAPAAAPTAAVADKETAAAEKIQGPPKTVVAARVTGTVKWFNVKSGYGFINRDDTKEDVFVHQTAIVKNNPKKYLRSVGDGEKVEFDVVEGDKGNEASNVTGPEGNPVEGSKYAALRRRFYRRPRKGEGNEDGEAGEDQLEEDDGAEVAEGGRGRGRGRGGGRGRGRGRGFYRGGGGSYRGRGGGAPPRGGGYYRGYRYRPRGGGPPPVMEGDGQLAPPPGRGGRGGGGGYRGYGPPPRGGGFRGGRGGFRGRGRGRGGPGRGRGGRGGKVEGGEGPSVEAAGESNA